MNLYPHQIKALEETSSKNRVAYYLDMGLGKTFIGSEKLRTLGNTVNLIICQKSKVQDWFDHFRKYYSDYAIFDLTDKKQFQYFFGDMDAGLYLEGTFVAVINYELAWRRPELLKLRDFTLMLDESSLIQNKTAKQTKFILKLQPENVILLSGTPCSGKYENLWTQARLLGWDISEKTYLEHYVERKLMDFGGVKFWKVLGYKNTERLKEKFLEHGSVFMKTDEVFDLPAQTFIDVWIDPDKYYKKFMKDSIVTIGSVELVGDTTLTKRLRARQICSIYNETRYGAFWELLEASCERLIVFYNFKAEAEKLVELCNKTGRSVSYVNGQVKDLTAYETCDDSITLVQYQAGAKGLNLQKANKIIYFSLTEKCDDWMQSQKRIHRIGQNRPCFYYIFKCKNSVEEKIHAALERGVDYTDELFRKDYLR